MLDDSAAENTMPAFLAALSAGATHIETDVRATSDGIAVLFHDSDLSRIGESQAKVQQLTWAQLSRLKLPGDSRVLRLEEALAELPAARFNLDIKSSTAISPAASAINRLRAHDRVLVSSFSEQRRRAALALLDSPVATSASAMLAASGYLARSARMDLLGRVRLLGIDALQVPHGRAGLNFSSERFIAWLGELGIEAHFWTVNDPQEMTRLVARGAKGLVTDRADLVPRELLQ